MTTMPMTDDQLVAEIANELTLPQETVRRVLRFGELAAPRMAHDGFEERGTEEQIAALYGALAEASASFAEPKRTKHVKITMKSGRDYEYDYAPLDELIAATRPALSAAGIFISHPPTRVFSERCKDSYVDGQGVRVEEDVWLARVRTVVSHKGGGRIIYTLDFFAAGDIKDYGGQNTYAQRYQYAGAVGIHAGEPDADDQPRDNGKETGAQVSQRRREPPAPAQQQRPQQREQPRQEPKQAAPAPKPEPQATPAPQAAPKDAAEQERVLSTPVPTPAPQPAPAPQQAAPQEATAEPMSDLELAQAALTHMTDPELKDRVNMCIRKLGMDRAGAEKVCTELGLPTYSQCDRAGRERIASQFLTMVAEREQAA